MMRTRFTNFWKGFEPDLNLFSDYLNLKHTEIEIVRNSHSKVGLEFFSVFPTLKQRLISRVKSGSESLNYNFRLSDNRVWFCGENREIPRKMNFDYYFSHNDSQIENIVYFPLWKWDIDWFYLGRQNRRLGRIIVPEDLIEDRQIKNEKQERVCFFVRNLTPEREKLLSRVSKFLPVDVFGNTKKNRVKSKLEISRNYKYILCPENTLSRGYTTEKLIEGYFGDSVPIYFGALPKSHEFNLDAFIYSESFDNAEDIMTSLMDSRAKKWESTFHQPLFRKPQYIDELHILDQIFLPRS